MFVGHTHFMLIFPDDCCFGGNCHLTVKTLCVFAVNFVFTSIQDLGVHCKNRQSDVVSIKKKFCIAGQYPPRPRVILSIYQVYVGS